MVRVRMRQHHAIHTRGFEGKGPIALVGLLTPTLKQAAVKQHPRIVNRQEVAGAGHGACGPPKLNVHACSESSTATYPDRYRESTNEPIRTARTHRSVRRQVVASNAVSGGPSKLPMKKDTRARVVQTWPAPARLGAGIQTSGQA